MIFNNPHIFINNVNDTQFFTADLNRHGKLIRLKRQLTELNMNLFILRTSLESVIVKTRGNIKIIVWIAFTIGLELHKQCSQTERSSTGWRYHPKLYIYVLDSTQIGRAHV